MSIYDRLTDASKYTGAHKARFTEDGKGKGIEGRADRTTDNGYVHGFTNAKHLVGDAAPAAAPAASASAASSAPAPIKKSASASSGTAAPIKKTASTTAAASPIKKTASTTAAASPIKKTASTTAAASPIKKTASGSAASPKKPSIFDKLTDASQYTGAHKERFDADGKGKGKVGRVDDVKVSGYVAGFTNANTDLGDHKVF
eukprot:TRINITY_DN1819_c0_g1_i1.p1 TRINITY_DN1819_c0_g1~~TRINITY_DN1819_c0_g1_i1.p1  ORF type:complete len:202 (+),score=65.80 TRINITY_DN1819_c0_g1_i1:41-646(+)